MTSQPTEGNAGRREPSAPGGPGNTENVPEWCSAQGKTDLVLRLLRGEALDAVSRESDVPAHELESWKRVFLRSGARGLSGVSDPLLAEAVRRIVRSRSRTRTAEERSDSPIRVVGLEEFHELFARNELGPTLRSEVSFIGGSVLGGTSDTETWVLAVLAKHAKTMFEFGTGTGKTTYLWARNSAPDARIITLTLGAGQHADYLAAEGDNGWAARAALAESASDRFLYSGTSVEHKITQLFVDSKRFDETPYLQRCDLIFIDGSHAYSYVRNDTEKALRMLRDGGVVLWHDYRDGEPETRGVRQYLDELCPTLPLVRLHGTSLVVHRAQGRP
jgi:hypothetical protein